MNFATVFKEQKRIPANSIPVPRKLTTPQLTMNINPCEHGFVSKMQTLIPMTITEFTAQLQVDGTKQVRADHTFPTS